MNIQVGQKEIHVDVAAFEQIRLQMGPWCDANFPVPDGDTNKQFRWLLREACGVAEEVGELIESVTINMDKDALKDALADIGIFMLSFSWHAGFSFRDIIEFDQHVIPPEALYIHGGMMDLAFGAALSMLAGNLCHACLKQDQDIRGDKHFERMKYALCHIYRLLFRYSDDQGWDFNQLVKATAAKVLKRDWRRYRADAHVHAETSV